MAHPDPTGLAPALLAWWARHGRKDLPWQREPTPYRVWVSEIMLQQTQVATVVRYYDRFIAAFPQVADLAAAPVDRVLHVWSGLGYYARARNLHRAARAMVERHGSEVPEDFDALVGLPGIGRSTAGAILALARNRRHPILDGNAKRVLARYFGVAGWPGRSAVARALWQLADDCTPESDAATYTQAIMDLGATVCVRGQPDCAHCPLAARCVARREGLVAEIPGRPPRRDRPRRETVALLVTRDDGAVLLERRPAEGIWGGLWGLPEAADVSEAHSWCEQRLGRGPRAVERRPTLTHGFTHFELDIHPVLVRVDIAPGSVMEGNGWLWYNRRAPAEVGLAAPVARLLDAMGDEA
jgi:A/G-specific adenine glycosylase